MQQKFQDPPLFRPGSVAPSLLGEDSGTRVTFITQSFLHGRYTRLVNCEFPSRAAGSCWSMLRDCGLAAGDGSTAVRGTPGGLKTKVSLQGVDPASKSLSPDIGIRISNCTMGSLYGVARESLAGTPCLRWPLSSMRRPSQFCRFYSLSEDKKQLACDIDIGFVLATVFSFIIWRQRPRERVAFI